MKIVLQNRMGETIIREAHVGQHLVGLRLIKIIFENSKELYELTTEEGQRWLKNNAHRVMHYSSNTPVTLENSPKESNWGSDWVDDGV